MLLLLLLMLKSEMNDMLSIAELPLCLFRVEIQDTALERNAILCQVNSWIETKSQMYDCTHCTTYDSRPFDAAFNSSKLIWDEMLLFVLLGLNVVSLIALNMLTTFYDASPLLEITTHWRLFWTQTILASTLPSVLTCALTIVYRFVTNRSPHYRKTARNWVTVLLSVVVIFFGK